MRVHSSHKTKPHQRFERWNPALQCQHSNPLACEELFVDAWNREYLNIPHKDNVFKFC